MLDTHLQYNLKKFSEETDSNQRDYLNLHTSQSTETWNKEHHQHIHLRQSDKLAVAQHSFNMEHHSNCRTPKLFSNKSQYTDCIISDATENEFPPNMNREDGLVLSRSWQTP
jgi:hypothetical protein